jgi:hypothetical protein
LVNDTDQNSTQHITVPYQDKSSVSSIMCNRLSILNLPDISYNKALFDTICLVLLRLPINTMNISSSEICVGTLVELIRSLPNLDSLVINSLTMTQPIHLSNEQITIRRFVSNNNKVTKVILQQLIDLAQMQFLIDLCPRLQHLEVISSNSFHLESFLRYTSMRNIKNALTLSSLCLRISKPRKEAIENVTKIIHLEKQYSDYTFEQKDNEVYLRWNKY